ncbi:MAG: hypothetical protein U0P45_01165 [Acidimicrobiales bacterium]
MPGRPVPEPDDDLDADDVAGHLRMTPDALAAGLTPGAAAAEAAERGTDAPTDEPGGTADPAG